MLLGEETSGNHQAYRRGHPDITILNEIIKGCEGVRQKLTQNYGESVYERKNTFYYIDTTVILGDTSTVQFNESEVKR